MVLENVGVIGSEATSDQRCVKLPNENEQVLDNTYGMEFENFQCSDETQLVDSLQVSKV